MSNLCVSCEQRPPRPLPDPIPLGEKVMWSEAVCGYGLYCQECFDADDEVPE